MCGIAGVLRYGRMGALDLTRTVEDLTAQLVHRGPDDNGAWVDAEAGVALGHRRLSVVDLSPHGHQPMVSPNGRWVATYNGEIYNAPALREALQERGAAFRGHSDTEVLVAAVDEWGPREALRRSEGMFAVALWDRVAARLYLARDRFGEKPLYVHRAGGVLSFASEATAFRVLPWFSGSIDRHGLALYFRWGSVPAPATIFEAVWQPLPGVLYTVDPRTGEAAPDRYVPDPEGGRVEAEPSCGTAAAAADRVDVLLGDAVGAQLASDVPIGAFLSGGVDSSLVVALMQARRSAPVKTFTIGFEEEAWDEAPYARAVAAHLGTDHTELYVTPREMLDTVTGLPALCREPISDTALLPTYLLASMTRRDVTVSLSGDGGDELFAGYTRYRDALRWWGRLEHVPLAPRRVGGAALAMLAEPRGPASVRRARWRAATTAAAKGPAILRASSPGDVSRILGARWAWSPVVGSDLPALGTEQVNGWTGGRDPVAQMMACDQATFLTDLLLPKVDRTAMAVSLETRMPFLSPAVVNMARSLPDSVLGPPGDKTLLRAVLGRYVPDRLIDRPKKGFGVPLADWLRGPLRDWGEDLVAPERVRHGGLLDVSAVRAVWDSHQAGRDRSNQVWDVLMFQAWLAGLGSPPAETPSAAG